jgi:hypothetical protein
MTTSANSAPLLTMIQPARSSTSSALRLAGDPSVSISHARSAGTTALADRDPGTVLSKSRIEAPTVAPPVSLAVDVRTRPIQVWEGIVLSVNHEIGRMNTKLRAKMGELPEHSATFDFQWIPEQDHDLVIPGAVFYLTLFRKLNRTSVENSQELRFRRVPNWSNWQIRKVREAARALETGMTIGRTID